MDQYEPALEAAYRASLDFLRRLDDTSVAAPATLDALRFRLDRPLGNEGCDVRQVIAELVADATAGINGNAGGRFFGWVFGGSLPAALAADWLTSTWDQVAFTYASSPASAVIEEITGSWLKEILCLPASASFAFVTGTQMGSLTGLAAARHHVLTNHGWDIRQLGTFGAPPITILTTTSRHGATDRALQVLGFGSSAIVNLPVDEQGRMKPSSLRDALVQLKGKPAIVVLIAGELNMGSFDRFAEVIPIAHEHGAWVHVDGAFGLWAAASSNYRHLTAGMELADSWVTDGHKWLNVPYDSGFAFVAHPDDHAATLALAASYAIRSEDVRDPKDWTPELSRRARGIATYAALRYLGRKGVEDLVDRCCHNATQLVAGIGELPGTEVVWAPIINQGLVRFLDTKAGASDLDHDRRTNAVIAAINTSGEAFFGGVNFNGKRCMRVSVSNWQTDDKDIDRTIAAIAKILSADP